MSEIKPIEEPVSKKRKATIKKYRKTKEFRKNKTIKKHHKKDTALQIRPSLKDHEAHFFAFSPSILESTSLKVLIQPKLTEETKTAVVDELRKQAPAHTADRITDVIEAPLPVGFLPYMKKEAYF